MTKIAIIHTLPLEFYPPVTNLIDFLSREEGIFTSVFSTKNERNRKTYYRGGNVKIHRSKNTMSNKFLKAFSNIKYSLRVFYLLIRSKPDILIYYETFSVGRALLPALFLRKTKLVIINHEYFSKEWYTNTASRSLRFHHKIEQIFLFKRAIKISQTNIDRAKLFLEDNRKVSESKMLLLPNYPSKTWSFKNIELDPDILKTVYVGTLSLEYSYVKEYCEWIISKKGEVIFDIYSYNLDEKTNSYIKGLGCPFIRIFEEGVDYQKIPDQIKDYHVGLVLYKALTKNYQFNAPNKIFEYLAVGLDVWCSDKLKTSRYYEKTKTFPFLKLINFEELGQYNWKKLVNKEGVKYEKSQYNYESVYRKIVDLINE